MVEGAYIIGLDVVESSLTPQRAVQADELFIAVTTKDIVPVIKFDGIIIGDGRPGPYTKSLIEEFRKFIV